MDTRHKQINFHDLLDVKLSSARKNKFKSKEKSQVLFPVEIVEKEAESRRVKVHYVGYGDNFDEWKDESELEMLDRDEEQTGEKEPLMSPFQSSVEHYCLFKDLSIKIKRALGCNRKASPEAKIAMSFDVLLFNGGLLPPAVPSRKVGGIQRYKIRKFSDLNSLLGNSWHFRGLNSRGDYGYVILETVEFYLRKSKRLSEYVPCPAARSDGNCGVRNVSTDTGYTLTFTFVVGYGTPVTFGKDKTVFYNM